MMDLQEAFDAGFEAVKNYVERSFDAYEARIDALERRFDALSAARDGKDAVAARMPEDMNGMITAAARKAFDEMEMPKDGVGLTGALIDKAGHLVLTLSSGEVKDVGQVCGTNGESIDHAAVQKQIADMFDALPKPKDGDSVHLEDVLPAIEESIANKFAALPVAKDGASVTLEDVAPMIEAAVEKRISALPAAKDGEPGKDADPVVIKQMVDEAVAALPPARDGKDCDMQAIEAKLSDAIYNAEGRLSDAIASIPVPKDGKSVTAAEIEPLVIDAVQKAVDAIPRPKDGKDGIGLAGAIQNKDGDLIITLSSGELINVGRVMGWDGADVDMESIRQRIDKMFAEWPKPKDGVDGLGFDDLDLLYDGEKTFTFRLSRGDRVKEYTFSMPVVIDRGVFKEGQSYSAGDGVTWGGSFWVCQQGTKEKPDSSKDWRLAVKRGKDGKDADPKNQTKPGPVKI